MAHYQNQYGDATRTDQYGNPVGQTQTDQYGNPVQHTTGGGGGGGATNTGYGTGSGGSSSSSEDEVDENGVRRKKGMKEKIKEKIPGVGTPPTTMPLTSDSDYMR
ncbi:dehydrin Xero 1-like [Senna tora]|uniref:Dehydrin Xero 1-like n=1 Tax=Senna tora TaxID=362788 RepID=A0A835CB54_9FABA|nr:dehydrin Xero 1-like [Senna tora]